jgi:hypothetical protein
MKVGDLVRLKKTCETQATTRSGVVIDIIKKKVWRSGCMGKQVDWTQVDPEDHATVLYDDCNLNIPVVDLEVISE